MKKTDCTPQGKQELSLQVMNTEGPYNDIREAIKNRLSFQSYVKNFVDDNFIYDNDQLQDLENTFNEECLEWERDMA